MTIRVLDLFCGAGGAGAGYARAGAAVVGVDLSPQPRYPFDFLQADALAVLRDGFTTSIDLIHASPPCQRYSAMQGRWGRGDEHPDLIADVRALLATTGVPYVIENVVGAPLNRPTILCGSMFALQSGDYQLRRHRGFEASFPIAAPDHPKHTGQALSVYGNPGGSSTRDGLVFAQFSDWKIGMEIDWMTIAELREAIPPAYTEWIARAWSQATR